MAFSQQRNLRVLHDGEVGVEIVRPTKAIASLGEASPLRRGMVPILMGPSSSPH